MINEQAQVHIECGDCLELMQGIPDGSIDAVIADPPYGQTACAWDSVIPFEPMWEELKRVVKANGAIVLFGSQPFTSALVMSNPQMFKYEWIYDKGMGTGHLDCQKKPLKRHESVLVFYSSQPIYNPQKIKGKAHRNNAYQHNERHSPVYGKHKSMGVHVSDEYYPISILYPQKESQDSRVHPTQKPVALIEYLIKTYTQPGETVLDFCFGSGTAAVACIKTIRNFIGFEKSEEYFCIAAQRIKAAQGLTGLFADPFPATAPTTPATPAQEALEL